MSERVLHEWTYWDAQSNGVSCSVEGEVGNPYRARVLEGSEYQLALEILNLAARIAEMEAENARLRKCVEAGDHYIDSIYSITSNTGLLHAEWSEKIDYYAARAEVDNG